MKAKEPGSLGGCYIQMDIGPLSLTKLQIPVGSTNGTVPEWLFPRRFPSKQRLPTSRPDAVLVTEMLLKKAKKLPDVPLGHALRSRTEC